MPFHPHLAQAASAEQLPLDKSAPIIAYCAAGERVEAALLALYELGYTNVYNAVTITRMAFLQVKFPE